MANEPALSCSVGSPSASNPCCTLPKRSRRSPHADADERVGRMQLQNRRRIGNSSQRRCIAALQSVSRRVERKLRGVDEFVAEDAGRRRERSNEGACEDGIPQAVEVRHDQYRFRPHHASRNQFGQHRLDEGGVSSAHVFSRPRRGAVSALGARHPCTAQQPRSHRLFRICCFASIDSHRLFHVVQLALIGVSDEKGESGNEWSFQREGSQRKRRNT